MKKIILLVILLFSILSLNFIITGSADEGDEWHVIDTWSGTFYNRSAVPLLPDLIINISVSQGKKFDIEWRTNATGIWTTFAENLSCINGSYSQVAIWANQSNTTYWWMYHINSSDGYSDSTIFNFTTARYTWGPWSDWWVIYLVPKELTIRSFEPITFGDKGMAFGLSFDIVIENYTGSIILNVSTREINITKYPENAADIDGKFIIENLPLPTRANSIDYPFDKYSVDINLKLEDGENLNTSKFEPQNYDIPQWQMNIRWSNNTLYAQFSRTQEVYIYVLLVIIGLVSIVTNFIYIFKSKNNIVNYIGEITSISFIFAGIIDFILNRPTFFSPYIIFLIIMLSISIVSSGLVIKEKKSEKEEK